MSVIGIDIGYQTCYVAVARQGGIETIANECSDRCTPTCISMGAKSRYMGAAAKNQMISNYKNTIWGWKQLLGRKFSDPVVQNELNVLSVDIVEGAKGSVGIKVNYMGDKRVFSPEQVHAMMLTKLKEITETALQTKVVDCVLNVPCYYTDVQRRAVLDAAALVGLNVLRLMNDTTATALNYGIYKQDLPSVEDKPRNVVFVDMGHSDIQLSVCALNKGKLKILATAADPHVGGLNFDRLIADHFCDEFKDRYRINVRSSPKVYLRLLQECERLKKLMSANSQEIPLSIECFMDDKDVAGKMGRKTLEKLAEPLLSRIEELMQTLLYSSKLKKDDIYSVEVVGGSSRIPAVKELVQRVFRKEASVTLNGDEAVARGCALQCAILSPSFIVRDFTVVDAQPYPITLSWQGVFNDNDGNSLEVCNQFCGVPFVKQLTFYRSKQFVLEARYNTPDIPQANSLIGSFTIDKVVPRSNGESAMVNVKVGVGNHGLFNVLGAAIIENIDAGGDETMDVDVEQKSSKSSMKNAGGKKDSARGNPSTAEKGRKPASGGPGVDNELDGEEFGDDESGVDSKKGAESKKKIKATELPVIPRVPRLTKDDLNLFAKREAEMIQQDKMEKERVDAKNAVEEYVYDMRKNIGGDMEKFILPKDSAKFLGLLEDTENWLYEAGENQSKKVYVDKLADLKKYGDPVTLRYFEYTNRPGAFESLGHTLQLLNQILDAYVKKDEKYDHIENADMQKVNGAVMEAQEWFEKYYNLSGQSVLHEKPVVTVAEINSKRETLISTCNPIVNKPKPKPNAVSAEMKQEATQESTNTSCNANTSTQDNDQMDESIANEENLKTTDGYDN